MAVQPIDTFTLDFENYCDLQMRLVLLPHNDSECTGAMIYSFQPQPQPSCCEGISSSEKADDETEQDLHGGESRNDNELVEKKEEQCIKGKERIEEKGNDCIVKDDALENQENNSMDDDAEGKPEEIISRQEDTSETTIDGVPNEAEIDDSNTNDNDNQSDETQTPHHTVNVIHVTVEDGQMNLNNEETDETECPSATTYAETNDFDVQEEGNKVKLCPTNDDKVKHNLQPTQTIVGAVLIRIQGANEEHVNCRTSEFTTILNTIREKDSSSIILHFECVDIHNNDAIDENDAEDGGIECVEETINDESRIDKQQQEDNTKAISGRLQRWGSQFAGEARKAVIAGRDLAKDKVNEVQQQRQKEFIDDTAVEAQPNGTEVALESNVDMSIPRKVQVPSQDRFRLEMKQVGPRICGMFLQTSSGKCIPLDEELLSPRARNDNDALSKGDDKRRRKNPFRKNPPTITNTSVLVIRTSADKPCPALGYTYQWYRSKESRMGSDNQELRYDDCWSKLDGATSVVFQPSSTDVGFQIKCVATIANPQESLIESDKVLFDAALKTFKPRNGEDSRICVSSFDSMMGMEGLDNIRIKLDLHTFRSEEKDGHRCFFMKAFNASEEPLYEGNEQITNISVGTYCDKATAFYLQWHSKEQQVKRILKLKAPSRIGKFREIVKRLTCDEIVEDIADTNTVDKEEDDDISTHSESDTNSDTDDDTGTCTPTLSSNLSSKSADTPGTASRRMIAIESELENDMNELKDRLEAKSKAVSDLQEDIIQLRLDRRTQCEENIETKRALRLSQRCIETLESDLVRLKEDQIKHSAAYKKKIEEHKHSDCEYDRLIKSLGNEKAVLSGAVEARDSKLTKMDELKNEVQSLKEQTKQDRKLQIQLDEVSSKNSNLKHTIMEMKRNEKSLLDEICGLKVGTESTTADLKRERKTSLAAKVEVSNVVSQLQTLKTERNRWKQKSESLIKEIEKSLRDHHHLTKEVTQLRSQTKKSEDELQDSLVVHAKYVQAQEKVKTEGAAIRAVFKCDELERIVSHLTEYVDAKETQLQSIQAVNRALSEELHLVHQKNRGDDDV
eukprot:scaffold1262_cov206-Chaetoceros_neogracile.AAC.8